VKEAGRYTHRAVITPASLPTKNTDYLWFCQLGSEQFPN